MADQTPIIPTFTANEWLLIRGAVTEKFKAVDATTPTGPDRDKLLAKWQSLEDKVDEAATTAHLQEQAHPSTR